MARLGQASRTALLAHHLRKKTKDMGKSTRKAKTKTITLLSGRKAVLIQAEMGDTVDHAIRVIPSAEGDDWIVKTERGTFSGYVWTAQGSTTALPKARDGGEGNLFVKMGGAPWKNVEEAVEYLLEYKPR